MPTTATTYRCYLPRKSTKGDCPQCSPKHRRTLSRYIDRQTGDALPDEYGRCDRESNCTYHVSPYHKGQSGMSYADEVYENWKTANPLPLNYTRRPMSKPPCPVAEERIHSLPAEVFQQSLGHYNQNQFASLLRGHFGQARANDLLKQFQIGTCHRPNDLWPETTATVFWIIDTEGRVRGGQVNQFATDWHRAKFKSDNESKERSCISSAGHALLKRYERNGEAAPGWLIDYQDNAEKWPIAFGLHQLRTAPIDMPFAFVEAVC